MKELRINIALFLLLLIYCAFDRFLLVIPISMWLFVELFFEFSIFRVDVSKNAYGTNMLVLLLFSTFSLLWAPNLSQSATELAKLSLLVINGYLVYYFVLKYQSYKLLNFTVFFFSFINYSIALNLPFFKFLAYVDPDSKKSVFPPGWGWGGRFSGTTENPNTLAITLLFAIFLSLYIISQQKKISKASLAFNILNIGLSVFTIFLTASRKGLLFGGFLIFLYFLLNFSFKKILYLAGVIIAVVIILFSTGIFDHFFAMGIERLEGLILTLQGKAVEQSAVERLYYTNVGIEGFLKSPFIGYGINSFRHYYGKYSHNNLIELAFGLGIFGPLIYYRTHFSIFRKLNFKKNNLPILSFLVMFLIMDVGYVSYESKMNMLTLITLLLLVDRRFEDSQEKDVNDAIQNTI